MLIIKPPKNAICKKSCIYSESHDFESINVRFHQDFEILEN